MRGLGSEELSIDSSHALALNNILQSPRSGMVIIVERSLAHLLPAGSQISSGDLDTRVWPGTRVVDDGYMYVLLERLASTYEDVAAKGFAAWIVVF